MAAGSAVLVVSSQERLAASGVSIAPTWITDAFTATGWQQIDADGGEFAVEFVDGQSRAADGRDYPRIEGIVATATLSAVAAVRVPVQMLRFKNPSAFCSTEVADIRDPLAQTWASQVAPADALDDVGSGWLGRADAKGVTLSTGSWLIRTDVWEEGQPGGSVRDASRLDAAAQDILNALVTASAS